MWRKQIKVDKENLFYFPMLPAICIFCTASKHFDRLDHIYSDASYTIYIIWWYDSIQTDHQLLGGCRLPVLVYCAMSGLTNARFCSDLVPGSYLNVKDFSYAQRRFFTLLSVATLKTFELKSQIWLFFRFCHVVLIEWEWTGTGSNWLRAETPVILECGAWLECASSSWAGGGGH